MKLDKVKVEKREGTDDEKRNKMRTEGEIIKTKKQDGEVRGTDGVGWG